MIHIKRIDINQYQYDGTVSERKILEKSLTKFQDGSFFSEKFQEGHWDGNIYFFNKRNDTFPVGFITIVTKYLKKHKVQYKITDNVIQPILADGLNPKLHQHQYEAVLKFLQIQHGIIQIPTRGGKTYTSGELINVLFRYKKIKNVLFITDSASLHQQAYDDLKDYLGTKIGSIKASKYDIQPVVVTTIQTMESICNGVTRGLKGTFDEKRTKRLQRKKKKNEFIKYLESVDFIIVDECHEYGKKSKIDLLKKCKNVKFALYMSATPFKSESILARYNMLSVSGEVMYEIPEETLKDRGILSRDCVYICHINHNKNRNINVDDEDTYLRYEKQVITHNFFRNQIITNLTEMCRKLNLKVLILFTKKEHGLYLSNITGDDFLDGGFSIKQRQAITKKFLSKKDGGVLLASNIFKKGITLPEVQVLINAGGGKEQSNVTQRRGRVLGVTQDKNKVLTIDFYDEYEYFTEHSDNRINEYIKCIPKEFIQVFDTNDKDFYSEIRNQLEEWFYNE